MANNIRKKIQDALSSEFIAGTIYRIDIDRVDVAPTGSSGIIRSLPLTGDRDKVKPGDTVKVVTVAGSRVALAGDVALDAATPTEAVGGLSDEQVALLSSLAAAVDTNPGVQSAQSTDLSIAGNLTVMGRETTNGGLTIVDNTPSYFISDSSTSTIGNANGNCVNIFNDNGGAAAIAFHKSNIYAMFLGIDDNSGSLKIGGWSMGGGNTYKVWSANNDGAGSGLDADVVKGVDVTTVGFSYDIDGGGLVVPNGRYGAIKIPYRFQVTNFAIYAYPSGTATVEVCYCYNNGSGWPNGSRVNIYTFSGASYGPINPGWIFNNNPIGTYDIVYFNVSALSTITNLGITLTGVRA